MPGYSMTEEIDVFATGGPATAQSVQQQYLDALNQSNQVAPTSVADIQAEAARLSQLFGGNQRRPTLYDMASSLSQGLAAQAASGSTHACWRQQQRSSQSGWRRKCLGPSFAAAAATAAATTR